MQLHLKAAANEAAVAARVDKKLGQVAMDEGWITACVGRRGAAGQSRSISGTGPEAVGKLLALTPVLPPGFDRAITVDGDRITATFTPVVDGLLDPDHPGLVGSLARGATGGIEGTVGALDYQPIDLAIDVDGSRARVEMTIQDSDAR